MSLIFVVAWNRKGRLNHGLRVNGPPDPQGLRNESMQNMSAVAMRRRDPIHGNRSHEVISKI